MSGLPWSRLVVLALLAGAPVATSLAGELAERTWRAINANRCEAAVGEVNKGLTEGEVDAYYLTGLMYLRGLCLRADASAAPRYFEPAAKAAHIDAARYLTMMHGLGRGVPQSYAQAGRWFQAYLDIQRMRNGGEPPPTTALDARFAEQWGVLGTVAAAVQERVQYPRRGARLQASDVEVRVVLELGPEGLKYGLFDARSGIETDVQSAVLRRSHEPQLEAIETVLEEVIDELAPYPKPEKPMRIAIPYRFRLI